MVSVPDSDQKIVSCISSGVSSFNNSYNNQFTSWQPLTPWGVEYFKDLASYDATVWSLYADHVCVCVCGRFILV